MSKVHGRRERRTLTVSTIEGLGLNPWPSLERVLPLERVIVCGGVETRTVSYAVTSVPAGQRTAQQLPTLSRDDWGIENSCVDVRDVTPGEDRCRVRTGHAPLGLPHVSNFAIAFATRLPSDNIAATLRQHRFPPAVLSQTPLPTRIHLHVTGTTAKPCRDPRFPLADADSPDTIGIH